LDEYALKKKRAMWNVYQHPGYLSVVPTLAARGTPALRGGTTHMLSDD
jgi:hypothetical protein